MRKSFGTAPAMTATMFTCSDLLEFGNAFLEVPISCVMEWLRCKKFGWFSHRPISPEWSVDSIEVIII
jgi:hypothetical protein